MRSIEDPRGMTILVVYKVPCTCGACYIGQTVTGRTVNVRFKEHQRYERLGQLEKSALAHHCWTMGHQIQLRKAEVLLQSSSWNVRSMCESLKIALMQGTINKEDREKLNNAWLLGCILMTQ